MKGIGETVNGPIGAVDGATTGQEFHFPGNVEDKMFAPAYGEFFLGHGGDVEAWRSPFAPIRFPVSRPPSSSPVGRRGRHL